MSRRISTGLLALLLAIAGSLAVAQVSKPAAQPAGDTSKKTLNEPVKRAMRLPGGLKAPGRDDRIRVNAIQMYNLLGRPYLADTGEGQVIYLYEHGRLIEEHIGSGDSMIVGQYQYERDGRFMRLTYSDGIVITPTFGETGELVALSSNRGRSIGFNYNHNEHGDIAAVTPVSNFYPFHSAVALLRDEYEPEWWNTPAPMDNIKNDEGENGRRSPPPGPNRTPDGDEPQYPYDPFPNEPKTPDGTPSIDVSAPRPPGGKLPPPMPASPVHDDGIDIIPVGGPGASNKPNPGVIGSEIEGLHDFDKKLKLTEQCHNRFGTLIRAITVRCNKGPTATDKQECFRKRENFKYHCSVGCDTGDYHLNFQRNMSPEELDFAPWEKKAGHRAP